MKAVEYDRDVQDARRWVADGNIGAIAFEQACAYLRLEPGQTRRAALSGVPLLVRGS